MPISRNVLIFGREPMLLQTRRRILEQAGFCVRTIDDPKGVAKTLSVESIDLLIICQSISDEEGTAALQLAQLMRPETKSLVMSVTRQRLLGGTNETAFSPSSGPQMFVQLVRKLTDS